MKSRFPLSCVQKCAALPCSQGSRNSLQHITWKETHCTSLGSLTCCQLKDNHPCSHFTVGGSCPFASLNPGGNFFFGGGGSRGAVGQQQALAAVSRSLLLLILKSLHLDSSVRCFDSSAWTAENVFSQGKQMKGFLSLETFIMEIQMWSRFKKINKHKSIVDRDVPSISLGFSQGWRK